MTRDKPSLYTGFVGEDRSQRVRKRLRVLYGEGADQRLGFTTNLSRTGCCINAALVFAAGTRVRGTLELPHGHNISFEAEVVWSRKFAGQASLRVPNVMGLCFVSSLGEVYEHFVHDLLRAQISAA